MFTYALFLLPFLTFLLLFFLFYSQEQCWRHSWLSASIAWGILLTAITEILSLFFLINYACLVGAWVVVSLAISLWLYLTCRHTRLLTDIQQSVNKLYKTARTNSFLGFSLLSLTILLALTGLVAIGSPPNNYDSMTYHMTRVMNWIQNRSVAHYPTHNLRQLDSPPWSGFAIMHLQVLSDGDRFANLVQWFSMVGCLGGVSLIARELGASLNGQILASIMCATVPMGVLQSVTTQNDYVVSFWLVCLAYNMLLIRKGQITPRTCLEFGSSLGLALLTKSTSYIYAFPFFVIGIIYLIKHLKLSFWKPAIFSIFPIILINISHWWRNFQAFQSPLGVSGDITKNHLFTPSAVISNIVRNIALHIPVVYQPINVFFEKSIILLHDHVLKLDANDPRTTFPGTVFQLPVFHNYKNFPIHLNEDISGNPLGFVLIFISIGIYIASPKLRDAHRNIYIFLLLSTVLIFNILLAWQPWATRLHLPLFVLIFPFAGDILSRILRFSKLNYVLVFILICGAFPYILFSNARPLIQTNIFITSPSMFNQTRLERYFNVRPDLREPYIDSVNTILGKGCYSIGLLSVPNSWEYPLWAIAKENAPVQKTRFRSVHVDNQSQKIKPDSSQNFAPCAVLAIDRDELDETIEIGNQEPSSSIYYAKIASYETVTKPVQVYLRKD
jgi:hypothetical protein